MSNYLNRFIYYSWNIYAKNSEFECTVDMIIVKVKLDW